MSDYLSASELADLLEVKPNQYCRMAALLRKKKWKHEIGASGLPRVARAYYERKMLSDDKAPAKYDDTPNRNAFA